MRPPTDEEAQAFRQLFDGIDSGLAGRMLSGRVLAVVEREEIRWAVLASPGLLALPESLREGAEAAGLPVGAFQEDGLGLDLQGAVEAATRTKRQTVRVNQKAAHLFLYHRDILGDSVLSHSSNLRPGDTCIVVDPRHEAIGIGVVVGRFKGSGAAVRPIHDLGAYLREQDRPA